MQEPLWERIKQLYCKYFGHKPEGKTWVSPLGKTLDTCKRCRHIVEKGE